MPLLREQRSRLSPALRLRIIEKHLRMVQRIAWRVRQELGSTIDLEDLEAYGTQGLLEALGRYDPRTRVPFAAFAHHRVRGAMLDGIRRMAYLPRTIHARLRAEERSGTTVGEVRSLLAAAHAAPMLEPEAKGRSPRDVYDEGPDPEQLAVVGVLAPRVHVAMRRLAPRERRLVRLCYFEGHTLAEAGALMGCSRSWACRLHARALEKLHRRITTTSRAASPASHR